MYERILVPTDGSQGSTTVAAHAAEIASADDAALFGLHVVEKAPTAPTGEGLETAVVTEVQTAMEASGEAALEELEATAEDHGVDVETSLRRGPPHRVILDYAEEIDADLIVMGTHGRRGLDRFLLGSVTERVLRLGNVPVLALPLTDLSVASAESAAIVAEQALADEGATLESLRDEPYRERSTWVVPAETADGRRVNVHVDASSGDAKVAHLE